MKMKLIKESILEANRYTLVLKSIFSIVFLFILTRIMGKKQISHLTFFDYVVGISIGNIAASISIEKSVNYVDGIICLIVYAMFPIILAFISMKSYFFRKIFDGKPTILIQNGLIIESGLEKAKMNVNDLLEECRIKSIFDVSRVEFAILETSGKISIMLKSENSPITKKDMNIESAYEGFCVNVILDGKILEKNLQKLNVDKLWIDTQLNNMGINDKKIVLLGIVDSNQCLKCYLKNENPPSTPLME